MTQGIARTIIVAVVRHYLRQGLLPLRWRNELLRLCARNRLVICNAHLEQGQPIRPRGGEPSIVSNCHFVGFSTGLIGQRERE
jgi:hypothetical protein